MKKVIPLFMLLVATAVSAQPLQIACKDGHFTITGDTVSSHYQWLISHTGYDGEGWQAPVETCYTTTPTITLDSCGSILWVQRNHLAPSGQMAIGEPATWFADAYEAPTFDVGVYPNPITAGQTLHVSVSGNWFKRYRIVLRRMLPFGNGYYASGWMSPGSEPFSYPGGFLLKGKWLVSVLGENECGERVTVSRELLVY